MIQTVVITIQETDVDVFLRTIESRINREISCYRNNTENNKLKRRALI